MELVFQELVKVLPVGVSKTLYGYLVELVMIAAVLPAHN